MKMREPKGWEAQKSGGPEGGAWRVGSPEGGGPEDEEDPAPEKVEVERVGARRVGSQKFRAFFPLLPKVSFFSSLCLWGFLVELLSRTKAEVLPKSTFGPPCVQEERTTFAVGEGKKVQFWTVHRRSGPAQAGLAEGSSREGSPAERRSSGGVVLQRGGPAEGWSGKYTPPAWNCGCSNVFVVGCAVVEASVDSDADKRRKTCAT